MPPSKDMQWIPSTGVLAVSIAAALIAAILVNIYIGHVKSAYESGAQSFYMLKEDIAMGNPVQERSLVAQQVPQPLLPAFQKAVTADDKGRTIIGRKAPRDLKKGTFLWFPDFIDTGFIEGPKIRPGCEMITIPVDPVSTLGVQPGGYVNIRGTFDISPDPKRKDLTVLTVMDGVQVRSLGGSNAPTTDKGRGSDNIQIVVRSTQANQLEQVQQILINKHFTLGVTGLPQGAAEPELSKEVLPLIGKSRGPAKAPAPLPPETAPPPVIP